MDGQTAGRTDYLIEGKTVGYELLLFYRHSSGEYPNWEFRYEGPFQYVSHTGNNPTRFKLKRITQQTESITIPIDAVSVKGRGQGFKISQDVRTAIENYSMAMARKHFQHLGYKVIDFYKTRPFDLECEKESVTVYVEVKGTQTQGESVILTSGEVEFARKNRDHMALFIMRSIQLNTSANGKPICSGGEPLITQPWDVNAGTLDPIAYFYKLPP